MNGEDDPFYRYMVDCIIVNHSKNDTIVPNLEIISKQTQRPANYIASYIAQRSGTDAKFDKSRSEWKFSGKISKDVLQNLYFDFVNMYVMCQRCHNPETNPFIKGKKKCQEIVLECRSCGHTSTHLKSSIEDKIVKLMCTRPMEPTKLKASKTKKDEKVLQVASECDNCLNEFEFINNGEDDSSDWEIEEI
jgi:translation initiation factor 2 beta subunit (eIF-2beta)/eIF-5